MKGMIEQGNLGSYETFLFFTSGVEAGSLANLSDQGKKREPTPGDLARARSWARTSQDGPKGRTLTAQEYFKLISEEFNRGPHRGGVSGMKPRPSGSRRRRFRDPQGTGGGRGRPSSGKDHFEVGRFCRQTIYLTDIPGFKT